MSFSPANWGHILAPVEAMEGCVGYLDWATGLVRLNASAEEFADAMKSADAARNPARRRALLGTITHEVTHSLQIATTGFLYGYAVDLYDLLLSCVRFPLKTFDDVPASAPPAVAAELRRHLNMLDEPGPDGVTLRSIVEGNAAYAEFRTHYPGLDCGGYLLKLSESGLPAEYTRAFEVACGFLGVRAFGSFGLLSSFALCTTSPPTSFGLLCHETGRRALPSDPLNNLTAYLQMANDLHEAEHLRMVGTAAEVVATRNQHPVYSPLIHALNDLCRTGSISVLAYLAAPHAIKQPMAVASARPVVLNATRDRTWTIHIPENWRPDLSRAGKESEAEFLLFLMGLSNRLLGSI